MEGVQISVARVSYLSLAVDVGVSQNTKKEDGVGLIACNFIKFVIAIR